jgi:hypothetical protein
MFICAFLAQKTPLLVGIFLALLICCGGLRQANHRRSMTKIGGLSIGKQPGGRLRLARFVLLRAAREFILPACKFIAINFSRR